MNQKLKKSLSIGIRVLLACVGIGIIIYAVVWTDHAVLDAGYNLPHGGILEKQTSFKVLEGTVAWQGDAEKSYVLAANQGDGTFTVPGSAVVDYKLGIINTLKGASIPMLVLGLLLVAPIYPIQTFRWRALLRARGLDVTAWQCFRLVMVGSFFNYCMPGTTGGDVLKAYYAARHSHRRTDSILSVLIDRVAGLAGLVILGGLAGLVLIIEYNAGWMEMPAEQYGLVSKVTGLVWLGMVCGVAGAGIYFSRRGRKLFKVDLIISKLPGKAIFQKIDQAAVAYRDHLGTAVTAILISVPVHFCLALSSALAGHALGMDHSYLLLMSVIPVLFLAGALPLTPQGVGVMEGLGLPLLVVTGKATANQVVGMLLLIRMFQIFYSMFGSIFLLKGDIHMRPAGLEEALEAEGEQVADVDTGHDQPRTTQHADTSAEPQPAT